MDFALREELAKKLKKRFRVVSPCKVGIGWVDVAIFGGESVGIDFALNYESSVERLNSFPFRKRIIVGECERCVELEELCSSYGIALDEPERFETHLSTKKLEDTIAFLYMTKEALDDGRFEDLKILGFATSYSRSKIEPRFFVSLTSDGYRVAKKIIYSRIAANAKKLEKISSPLNYLIALGLSNYLSFKPEEFFTLKDLKSLLQFYRKIPPSSFKVHEGHPKVMLAEFLVKSALNHEALDLAKKLCDMGLATKFRLFSPSGDFIWEEFRFAREVVEFLIKSSFFSVEREIIEELSFLLNAMQGKIVACESMKRAEELGLIEFNKPRFGRDFEEFVRVRIAMLAEKILEKLDLCNKT